MVSWVTCHPLGAGGVGGACGDLCGPCFVRVLRWEAEPNAEGQRAIVHLDTGRCIGVQFHEKTSRTLREAMHVSCLMHSLCLSLLPVESQH